MATLVVSGGPVEGEQFALGKHRLVMIGRDEECTFQVLDQQISRRHMQIRLNDDQQSHSVIDFGSANGVRVNAELINSDAELVDGDEIHIGETTILYTQTDSPDAKAVSDLLRKRGEHRKRTLLDESS